MPKINQHLLDRLMSKLSVSSPRIYHIIAEKASDTLLDRHLAALVVASENGINIQKYSTPEERAQIRGSLRPGGGGSDAPQQQSQAANGAEPRARKQVRVKRIPKVSKAKDNSVFVVHGRNDKLRRALFDFLRALGLKPLEWEKVVLMTKKSNPYIGDILDNTMAKVQAVVVLFSPDDEAKLRAEFITRSDGPSEKKLRGQPRPNVLFEAGLALGRHPDKTIVVEVGKLRKFSDIAGRHVVRLSNEYSKRNDLANRLENLGCKVDKQGTDWTQAGDFTVP
jgi:predicted nucleotide-binding protein